VYLAFPVPVGGVPDALAGARALGFEGLSVTMPHKAAAAGAVDRLSPTAARLGAVNTVVRRGHEWLGDSTDGDGLLDTLRGDQGWDPADRRCVVLGTGGAARAVALALGQAGADEVAVVGRRPAPAELTAALAGPAGRTCGPDAVDGADLVVNATPVGMAGVARRGRAPVPAIPFDLDIGRLGPGQLVVDLVYAPAVTPLVAAARQQGARAANGVGMLVHQAARQFRLWTGAEPPLPAMSAAVLAALGP
jgi:shikimate dehydrogenase